MWIEGIRLEDFLRFDKASLEFSPGLNIVLSPNEGGKSSLFRAITTALYTDAASRSADVRSLARWGRSGLFALSLDISLGGASFRIDRDFRSKSQTIRRRGDEAPLARGKGVDEFLRDRLAIADQSLFLRVCGVRHEELGAVREGTSIAEKIEEILGGGWGEMTPAKVRQTVEARLKDLARGRDHPAREENWGAAKRLAEQAGSSARELERGRETARRRAEILGAMSAIDTALEKMEADLEALGAKKDRALQYVACEEQEIEARRKAEMLRGRIERIKALLESRRSLAQEGERIPESMRKLSQETLDAARRDLDLEERIAREIETAPSPRGAAIPLWKLVAASAAMAIGAFGCIAWGPRMLIVLCTGIALAVWCLLDRRAAAPGLPLHAREEELAGLRNRCLAWSENRSLGDSRALLDECRSWRERLKLAETRLEEASGGPLVDPDALIERLDEEYGAQALDARAFADRRASLAPFRADGEELARIDREMRRKEAERDRSKGERDALDRELAALPSVDLGEIEERLESTRGDLRRAERRVRVLDAIIEAIDGARGEMAGALAERLPRLAAAYLADMTGGRYRALTIDPLTMTIETVPAAEDLPAGFAVSAVPERIGTAALSQGARDQVYLAVRIALVDLMSVTDPQPLFLDDAFVHFDPARRERALALVAAFARTHQVVIFTCDPRYRALDARLIELAPAGH